MRARKLFHYKARQGLLLVEMIIWELPEDRPQRPRQLKYRLHCGRERTCVVRYDNETGKGDHRHYGDREEAYEFLSVERLLLDFREDCARLSAWRWKE